jgi:hypothetical protein
MSSKLIKTKSSHFINNTSNLGVCLCIILFLVVTLYFVNSTINKTMNNVLINPIKHLFSSKEENFFVSSPYDTSTVPTDINIIGFYNIVLDGNILTTGNVGSTDIRIIDDRNTSDDINTIFCIVKINKSFPKFDYKHYIVPISNGFPLSKSKNENKLVIHSDALHSNWSVVHTNPYVLEIRKENDIHYIHSGQLALTLDTSTNKLSFMTHNNSELQKIKLTEKNKLNYFSYDTGYYELVIEQDNYKIIYIVRLERVEDETQTYHMLGGKLLKEKKYSDYKNSEYNLQTYSYHVKTNGEYKGKNNINSKFIIQPLNSSLKNSYCMITNKDVLTKYENYTAWLTKINDNIGLINGYYFISYQNGSDTYLLTYDNKKIKIVKTNKDVDSSEIHDIINSSDGSNIFEIKNDRSFYHSLKVTNNGKYLNVESQNTSLEINFNKSINNVLLFNIFKEQSDYYSLSILMNEISDDNTNIKQNGTTNYLHILGNELTANNSGIESIKDSNTSKFKFHLIATSDDNTYSATESTTCSFRARFNKMVIDDTELLVSVDNELNLHRESQLKNRDFMKKCVSVNSNLKYNPKFLNNKGFYNTTDKNYSFTENDFRTIDTSVLSDNSKNIENVSVNECKNKCDIDNDCQEFLHQLTNVGSNPKSNRYNGNCLLLNHNDKGQTITWNSGARGIGYAAYSKTTEEVNLKPTESSTKTTLPAVINRRDESCTYNIDTCEDKPYCQKVGNKCLRKCNIEPSSGISDSLSTDDIDNRCVGTLNDFNIIFKEVNRNIGPDEIQKSILINVEAEFKNKNKVLHHPILKLQGGFKVMFQCLGNSALSSTKFEEVIDYEFDYDNHNNYELKISDIGTNLNIPLPNTISQCINKGNDVILSVQLVDIHEISNSYLVEPQANTGSKQLDTVIDDIRAKKFDTKFNSFIAIFNAINNLLPN